MLAVLHAVISVINSVLRLVAVAAVTGGTFLIAAGVVAIVVLVVLALSGTGIFAASVRKDRSKPPS